jgi:hypothetical protein
MHETTDEWPARSEFQTLPDSQLLAHGETVIEAKHDAHAAGNRRDERLLDKRLEAIRDELKRRTRNRYSDTATAETRLNDLDEDLRTLIYSGERRTA